MWFLNWLFGRDKDREWERIEREKARIDREWEMIYEKRQRLREREREIWDLEDRLFRKERALRRLDDDLKHREKKVKEKEKKVKEKEEKADRLYQALKEGYQKLQERKEQIKKKMQELKEREKEFNEQVKSKMQELKEKEEELKRREEELKQRERELTEGVFVKKVPVRIKVSGQDKDQWHGSISFEVDAQYVGMIRSEIYQHLKGTEYKITDDGFYWKFRVRSYPDKVEPSDPRWFHVIRWLEDNRVFLANDQYAVVLDTSGIAGWDIKQENVGNGFRITHICESVRNSGFAEVEVMVGESAQRNENEEEIPF